MQHSIIQFLLLLLLLFVCLRPWVLYTLSQCYTSIYIDFLLLIQGIKKNTYFFIILDGTFVNKYPSCHIYHRNSIIFSLYK